MVYWNTLTVENVSHRQLWRMLYKEHCENMLLINEFDKLWDKLIALPTQLFFSIYKEYVRHFGNLDLTCVSWKDGFKAFLGFFLLTLEDFDAHNLRVFIFNMQISCQQCCFESDKITIWFLTMKALEKVRIYQSTK